MTCCCFTVFFFSLMSQEVVSIYNFPSMVCHNTKSRSCSRTCFFWPRTPTQVEVVVANATHQIGQVETFCETFLVEKHTACGCSCPPRWSLNHRCNALPQSVQEWQADDNYLDEDHGDDHGRDHGDDQRDQCSLFTRVCPTVQEWRPEICDCDCPRNGERAACRWSSSCWSSRCWSSWCWSLWSTLIIIDIIMIIVMIMSKCCHLCLLHRAKPSFL